jgi:hypothetical protein
MRGACRTVPFIGSHPKVIQDVIPKLKKQFAEELEKYKL